MQNPYDLAVLLPATYPKEMSVSLHCKAQIRIVISMLYLKPQARNDPNDYSVIMNRL